MFSEEGMRYISWRYIVPMGIFGIMQFFPGHHVRRGDPVVVLALLLWWILYSLWSWKNKKELFKRWLLALPLGILATILLSFTGLGAYFSYIGGLLLFILLTRETKNFKQDYVVGLCVWTVLIIMLAVLYSLIKPTQTAPTKSEIYILYIVMGGIITVSVFYDAYDGFSRANGVFEWKPIVAKSAMRIGMIFLLFALFIISDRLCKHFNVGFEISFGISVLIAVVFFVFLRFFNIKNPAYVVASKSTVKKANYAGECECCGKTGISQDLLFKIDSGQRVCVGCLVNMEKAK